MDARIRRSKPSDGRRVRANVETVMKEFGLWRAHKDHMEDLADPRRHFLELLVVVKGGRVVGCGGLKSGRGKTGEICRMYLLKKARGLGLGKALLARLERTALARGLTRLTLESSRRYQDALGLYTRAGFSAAVANDGRCCDVLMVKELAPASRRGTSRRRAGSTTRRAARR